jgi:hypothetical protein
MTTITVSKVWSEEGLLALKEVSNTQGLEVKETETGKVWVNFGGFNGNPKDLWLRKKGTTGATAKTRIRVWVASYKSIAEELEWKKIPISTKLTELVDQELAFNAAIDAAGLETIAAFCDVDKAAKYLAKKAEKNSHQFRTYLGNKCVNMGAPRSMYPILKKRCQELLAK